MAPNEMMMLATYGVMLAGAVRWLFDLDVGFVFAAVVGVLSLLAVPWITTNLEIASTSTMSGTLIGAFLTSVVLGITQVFRSLA